MLESYAFCRTDNDFVDYSDFVAMTINYVIEKEMEKEGVEFAK